MLKAMDETISITSFLGDRFLYPMKIKPHPLWYQVSFL